MDNLIIFFDNITFKTNNIIINYIKRLVLYEIIYNKILNKQVNNVYVLKTKPNLISIKLNDKDKIDINKLLLTLNNITYKNYNSYEIMSFKEIMDKISEFEINTKKNKIIIICSIVSPYTFTEINKKYIKKTFENYGSEIKLINISNYPFFNKIIPSISEYFLNIKEFKTENLKVDEIFDSIKNYADTKNINKFYFDIKNFSNSESVDLDDENKLLSYLMCLSYSQQLILNMQTTKKFYNQNNIDVIEINNKHIEMIKKIIIINLKSENNIIKNICEAFKNTINIHIHRLSEDLICKLPINQLEYHLFNSYIKYILEFYEILYPKMHKYKSTSTNYINNLIKKKFTNPSKIKLGILPEIKFNEISTEYLKSTLSLTNWMEEYNNYNPFGFLIKYNPDKLSYKGILDLNSSIYKTYPNMLIHNITTNWVGIYDYYQIILSEYESNLDNYENTNKQFFNISDFNIIDNIQGDGNVLLPIFINKNHWSLVKSIWTYHMSFINNCIEPEYDIKMDNIYFLVFLKIFTNLKNINQNTNYKLVIILFCNLLRTCIQILIDNKFLHSIKKEYSKYFQLLLNTKHFEKNTIFFDWLIRLIQLIISNSCDQEQLENDLNVLNHHIFSKFIISNYDQNYWKRINNPSTPIEKINTELDMLKINVLQQNMSLLFLNYDIKIINKIIKSIYAIEGFNKFIKTIDSLNGMLELNSLNNLINFSSITKIIENMCMDQFNLEKYNVDISKFYIK